MATNTPIQIDFRVARDMLRSPYYRKYWTANAGGRHYMTRKNGIETFLLDQVLRFGNHSTVQRGRVRLANKLELVTRN